MGAHNFIDSAYGKDAAEAYKEAVEEARFEYGNNAYNGTISTTSGFVMIPVENFETLEVWEQRIIDDPRVQKWEDCACAEDPAHKIENGRRFYRFAGWAAS